MTALTILTQPLSGRARFGPAGRYESVTGRRGAKERAGSIGFDVQERHTNFSQDETQRSPIFDRVFVHSLRGETTYGVGLQTCHWSANSKAIFNVSTASSAGRNVSYERRSAADAKRESETASRYAVVLAGRIKTRLGNSLRNGSYHTLV